MFFRILLGIIVVFSIIIYVNMDDYVSPVLVSPTTRANDMSLQNKEFLAFENKKESHNVTIPDKINTSANITAGNEEIQNSVTSEESFSSAIISELPNYSIVVSVDTPAVLIEDKVIINRTRNLEASLEKNKKVEPGTIFIPFSTKNCGWFCK